MGRDIRDQRGVEREWDGIGSGRGRTICAERGDTPGVGEKGGRKSVEVRRERGMGAYDVL